MVGAWGTPLLFAAGAAEAEWKAPGQEVLDQDGAAAEAARAGARSCASTPTCGPWACNA